VVKQKIKCSVDREGFEGLFIKGNAFSNKVLISAGAALSNKLFSKILVNDFIKEDINILILTFPDSDKSKGHYHRIKIDFVDFAIKWLKDNYGFEIIVIYGISTGALYSLVASTKIFDIDAVLLASPFDYVYEACIPPNKGKFVQFGESVFSYKGEDIPFFKWQIDKAGIKKMESDCNSDTNYGKGRFLRYLYDYNNPTENSRVSVEKINADILLLASKDDDYWPAVPATLRIEKHLKDINYPHKIETKIYDKGSHLLGFTFKSQNIFVRLLASIFLRFFIPAEKNYSNECMQAREDSVKRLMNFYKNL